MKKFLLGLIMLLSLSAIGQNGGQYAENNVVKVAVTAHTATTVTVTVTNKQPGAADYRVSYATTDTTVNIAANGTYVVTIPNTPKFKVKALNAVISQPDMGWVELNVLEGLPVKFEYFKVEHIEGTLFKVSFQVAEAELVKEFIITLSEDGKTFKSVLVVKPDAFTPNKLYTEFINIK